MFILETWPKDIATQPLFVASLDPGPPIETHQDETFCILRFSLLCLLLALKPLYCRLREFRELKIIEMGLSQDNGTIQVSLLVSCLSLCSTSPLSI